MTQTEIFTGEVLCQTFIRVTFSHVRFLRQSLMYHLLSPVFPQKVIRLQNFSTLPHPVKIYPVQATTFGPYTLVFCQDQTTKSS